MRPSRPGCNPSTWAMSWSRSQSSPAGRSPASPASRPNSSRRTRRTLSCSARSRRSMRRRWIAADAEERSLYQRGYRWCRCYSVQCLAGEEGHVHLGSVIPVTRTQFDAANQRGWSLHYSPMCPGGCVPSRTRRVRTSQSPRLSRGALAPRHRINARITRVSRGTQDARSRRRQRDARDARDTRDTRDVRDARDMRALRRAQEPPQRARSRTRRRSRTMRHSRTTRDARSSHLESMRAMSARAEQPGPAAVATSAVCERCPRRPRRRSGDPYPASARPRGSAGQIVWSVGFLGLGAQRPYGTSEARVAGACREWLPALVLQVIDRHSQRLGRESRQRQPRSPVHGVAGAFEHLGIERHADRDRPRGNAALPGAPPGPVEEGGNTAARGRPPGCCYAAGAWRTS